MSVAFSPDGQRIVSGSLDRTVRLGDVETGAQVGSLLEGHTTPVYSAAFSPDGQHIASGSEDRTVRITNTSATEDSVRPIDLTAGWATMDGYLVQLASDSFGYHLRFVLGSSGQESAS
ncbi:hypothetical protein PIIN_11190 [Serendipita indica DSM 11827]|uniref:Uncharacterized protein n=1 Tax=Serendipita indica (strain DSM 11827) TaxID=1109443 RepID=G4U0W5_SERID|nr:hypothetical protein PIIN_11190 [Serendipita indica DSM 11827]